MFQEHKIISECESGGYMYAHTKPLHPKANENGLYPSHRIIMENFLERYLDGNEVVHHVNGNKKDNTLSNLKVLDNAQHTCMHWEDKREENIQCICSFCGKHFELKPCVYRLRANRNKSKNIFCSRSYGTKFQFFKAGKIGDK